MPSATTRPPSSSTTRSARLMVDSRWAMTSVVRSAQRARAARRGSAARPARRLRCVASSSTRIGGFGEQRAGDRDALALAARERVAALADDACRSRRAASSMNSSACAAVGRGLARRRATRRGGRRRCCRGSTTENRNGSSSTMPTWWRRLGSVRSRTSWPSIEHRAVVDVVEAGEQPGDGRLAAAGAPDERDGLARARRAGRSPSSTGRCAARA